MLLFNCLNMLKTQEVGKEYMDILFSWQHISDIIVIRHGNKGSTRQQICFLGGFFVPPFNFLYVEKKRS